MKIVALLALLASAIQTPRDNSEQIANLKKELDEFKESGEDSELNNQLETTFDLAIASRPPSQEQIDIAKSGGVGVTHDPAQPRGQKEAGNPEVEKKLEEGGAEEEEETNEETDPETVSDDERVESLKSENSRDQLIRKAKRLGIEVATKDNMTTIAEKIVAKENEG